MLEGGDKFQASLVYKESSRLLRATQQDPVWKQHNRNRQNLAPTKVLSWLKPRQFIWLLSLLIFIDLFYFMHMKFRDISFFFSSGRASLYSLGRAGAHRVNHAGLKLRDHLSLPWEYREQRCVPWEYRERRCVPPHPAHVASPKEALFWFSLKFYLNLSYLSPKKNFYLFILFSFPFTKAQIRKAILP